ncbi:Beige/BEACH domain containing protein [Histomonas meleagridis]|uniref:Beige/BEACH domain containing protein n=1 Tax=Histomonas meleagridis TaxID=135588 RepID=UPI003559A9AE|nr:Beige/BEACH domain containing protein [Histomonas meleagridis]KAH0802540.1 Beige/BEACH domain containing protein [Histomonas meleagridis]
MLWDTVTSPSIADYRELIPEFYTTPKFLVNADGFNLGLNPDGSKIDDVILPKWAKDHNDFISKHRAALESTYISINLCKWIDLIFGYKQNGKEAIAANNTFHPYTYPTYLTNEVMNNPEKLIQCQQFAALFGIIPNQLFKSAHPSRSESSIIKLKVIRKNNLNTIFKVPSKPIFVSGNLNTLVTVTIDGILYVYNNHNNSLIETPIGQCVVKNNENLTEKSFDYNMDKKLFIASSPLDSIFHIYQINEDNVKLLTSKRQNSLIHSLIIPSQDFLMTASRDSSLILWKLKQQQQQQHPTMNYQISPHSSPIVDFDTSNLSDLIICAYKSRKITLNKLSDGSNLHSITMDLPILNVRLTHIPTLLVILSSNNGKSVKLVSLGTDMEFISESEIDSDAVNCCEITLNGKNSLLALSDKRRHLSILSLPAFLNLKTIEVDSNITSLDYDPSTWTLVMGLENNSVQAWTLR